MRGLNFASILAQFWHIVAPLRFPVTNNNTLRLLWSVLVREGGWEWEFLLVEQYRTVLALTVCTIIKSLGGPKFRGVNLMDI